MDVTPETGWSQDRH